MKFTFAPESRPLDGFTIKRAIARGGFGEVYYALADSGKEVAIKLLQDNLEVELRGVTQCLNLKHPNLVTLFDIKQDGDGDHWIVMEFVGGKTLDRVVHEHANGLPLDEVLAWLEGIAAGIGFLHDRGIVHRDLKPANIFRENGIVKVGDVGLSKFIAPSRRSGAHAERRHGLLHGSRSREGTLRPRGRCLFAGGDPVRITDRQGALRWGDHRRNSDEASDRAAESVPDFTQPASGV